MTNKRIGEFYQKIFPYVEEGICEVVWDLDMKDVGVAVYDEDKFEKIIDIINEFGVAKTDGYMDYDFIIKGLPVCIDWRRAVVIELNGYDCVCYYEKLKNDTELQKELIRYFEGECEKALPEWFESKWLKNQGYEKIGNYKNGWYGDEDNPCEIIGDNGVGKVFKIDYIQPFETGFSLWEVKNVNND